MTVCEALAPATATWPQEEEYQYDSNDSVLDLDEEYPGLAERVMQWWAASQGTTCAPLWQPSNFGWSEQSHCNKLPDLRELLNQAEEAKACQWVPEQSVAPTALPFASVRDLDRQRQQRHDQTLAQCQSSPLGGEQRKRAKIPLQPDPYDAPDVRCSQEEQKEGHDRGRLRTRVDCQAELYRAHSKSRKRSKSRRQSKSRRRSKSRRSKSPRREGDREWDRHEPCRPGVWSSTTRRRALSILKWLVQIPEVEGRGRKECPIIHQKACHRYFPHSQPRPWSCQVFVVFGDQAQKFAAEVLTIIEWGTQHWKLQETFPVPVIPRWLRTPEFTQTMTPLRGELPLMPTGGHIEDICMRCPVMWSWMAVLLQYWQDHMTPCLYGGQFRRISDLAATIIRDINPWLPHQACFGWGYVAMNAMLWIDLRDHFAMEHHEEWTEQKE